MIQMYSHLTRQNIELGQENRSDENYLMLFLHTCQYVVENISTSSISIFVSQILKQNHLFQYS
jgi:hypothetical protein